MIRTKERRKFIKGVLRVCAALPVTELFSGGKAKEEQYGKNIF